MDKFDKVRRRSPYADPREYKSVQECNEYMLESTVHADVNFMVGPENGEKKEFKAHSFVLFSRCPVFGKLFAKQMEAKKVQGNGKMFKPTKNITKGKKEKTKGAKAKTSEDKDNVNQLSNKNPAPAFAGVQLKKAPQKAAPPKQPPLPRDAMGKTSANISNITDSAPASMEELLKELDVRDDGKIRVKDVQPNAFKELLRYLYSEEVDLTTENVLGVTAAAYKFRIYSLTEICQQFIKHKLQVTEENVLVLLEQGVPNRAESLVEDCLDFIDEHPEICETDGFKKLPKPILDAVYVHIME